MVKSFLLSEKARQIPDMTWPQNPDPETTQVFDYIDDILWARSWLDEERTIHGRKEGFFSPTGDTPKYPVSGRTGDASRGLIPT